MVLRRDLEVISTTNALQSIIVVLFSSCMLALFINKKDTKDLTKNIFTFLLAVLLGSVLYLLTLSLVTSESTITNNKSVVEVKYNSRLFKVSVMHQDEVFLVYLDRNKKVINIDIPKADFNPKSSSLMKYYDKDKIKSATKLLYLDDFDLETNRYPNAKYVGFYWAREQHFLDIVCEFKDDVIVC